MVATLCGNTPAHLAAYLAVPSMGAVLHTLNLRLSDAQLVYIVNHAADRVVIVDADLTPQLARLLPDCPTVTDVVVVGQPEAELPGVAVHQWSALPAAELVREWPRFDERSAAALCYTTGTTGDPKGVAYSHRSIVLHSLTISTGSAYGSPASIPRPSPELPPAGFVRVARRRPFATQPAGHTPTHTRRAGLLLIVQ